VSVCLRRAARGSSNPTINPLRQMAAPWPHPTSHKKYINSNKAGKEKKKEGRKKAMIISERYK